LGAHGTLTFTTESGSVARYNIQIERFEPPRYFAFRWIYPDGAEPDRSNAPLVEFTQTEDGPKATRLALVESGIRSLNWDDAEKERYSTSHSSGWDGIVGRLQQHLRETALR
jgi:uncharacterized protein YndB with AHSA1/START domain